MTVETSPSSPGSDGPLSTLLESFVTLLPVDDAAASTLNDPFDVEVLFATSAWAGALDEAQIDLGEGPAWDAYRSGRPVQLHLDRTTDRESWPFFASALTSAGQRSVLCVPLVLGTLDIGAVSLYSATPVRFEAEQLRLASNLSGTLARAVLSHALEEAETGRRPRDAMLSRREVHQATGMVFSQTGFSAADALLMIRAHAFATGSSVRDVSAQIIARTLDFTPDRRSDDGE